MLLRPVDPSGDILSAGSLSALLRGAPAAALLAEYRLNLLAGDWWENPSHGNEILELLRETRLSEADCAALSAYLSDYLRETPGVRDVRDDACSFSGGRLSYACTLITDAGSAEIRYSL